MTDDAQGSGEKLSLRTKIGFATGNLEEAMVLAASATTLIFYNQVMGLPLALCGTAFLIGSMVDAISDPLVGAFSDSIRTRFGRRHPLMFCSAFPIGIFFYYLYQPPSGLEENQLFYWYVAMYVGLNLSKTFYGVPHSALGAELSRDYNERTKLFGWNWVAYYLGAAVLPIFIMSVIFASSDEFENGFSPPADR